MLIAGCGYVGAELAAQLQNEKHQVIGLSRSASGLPRGVQAFRADVSERDSLLDIPEDIDFLVYSVAASDRSERGYHLAYVKGLQNILSVLREKSSKLQRVFFTSSSSVYGQDEGEWVDEDSETVPSGFSGAKMLEAEEMALSHSYPATIVRLSGIYGPGRTWMIQQVAQGKANCYFGAPRYTNRIHRDDCAGAIRHLMGLAEPKNRYLVSDDEPNDRSEFIRWLQVQLDAPQPQTLAPEHASQRALASNKRCRNDRLKASGYQLKYPTYREGYGELCRAYLGS